MLCLRLQVELSASQHCGWNPQKGSERWGELKGERGEKRQKKPEYLAQWQQHYWTLLFVFISYRMRESRHIYHTYLDNCTLSTFSLKLWLECKNVQSKKIQIFNLKTGNGCTLGGSQWGQKEQADKRQDPKTAKGHKWKNNNEHWEKKILKTKARSTETFTANNTRGPGT